MRGESWQHETEVRGPFNLQRTVESGQAFRWRRTEDGYRCVISGHLLTVAHRGNRIYASFTPERPDGSEVLQRLFRLDDNFQAIRREIKKDSHISDMLRLHSGMRILRQDPWECLVSFLCSINSNIPRISRDVEVLSERYGERIVQTGERIYAFPTAERLSKVDERELRSLSLGFRSKYIVSAAQAVADGFDLEGLRKMSYETALNELMSLNGVGPKVADCILLFSLDKLEAFPVDRWVKRGVENMYFAGAKMSEKRVREWAWSYFGRYAGYAQQYLFHQSRTFRIRNASA